MEIPAVFARLVDLGVGFIRVNYSGGGDSGAIDDIYFHSAKQLPKELYSEDGHLDLLDAIQHLGYGDEEEELDNLVRESINIEVIESWCYRNVLNSIEDWYNNDGGYGQIGIDPSNSQWHCTNHIYYTETETYDHSGLIDVDSSF